MTFREIDPAPRGPVEFLGNANRPRSTPPDHCVSGDIAMPPGHVHCLARGYFDGERVMVVAIGGRADPPVCGTVEVMSVEEYHRRFRSVQ